MPPKVRRPAATKAAHRVRGGIRRPAGAQEDKAEGEVVLIGLIAMFRAEGHRGDCRELLGRAIEGCPQSLWGGCFCGFILEFSLGGDSER